MGEETVLTVAQATTETPEPSATPETPTETPIETPAEAPAETPAEATGAEATGAEATGAEATATADPAAEEPAAAEGEGEAEGEGLIETIIDAVTDVVEDVVPGGEGETTEEAEGPATGEVVGIADDHGAADEDHGPAPELWLVLALVALFVIAFRPAKRAVLGALDDRAGRIRDELEEAQRLREEAQAALANFQRQQRDALGEAGEIIAHAQAEAERLREHAAADMEETLKRRETMAMDRIAQAEAAALAEVRGVAVDVAIAAARDVIGAQLDKSQGDALVDDAIKDLPNQLH